MHDNGIYNKSSWKGITLTDAAVQRILQLVHKDPSILGIKITVKKSGCAGLSYNIEKMIDLKEDSLVYEKNGAKVFVPVDTISIIDGTELDYVQEGLNCSFKFNNPQVQYACGCGESFGI